MIHLNDPNEIIDVDGVHMTLAEIKEAVIDSHLYRKSLKELMEVSE